MDERLIEEMYRLEERYWWHVNKRACVSFFLREWGGIKAGEGHPARQVLDLGCGTGMMVKEMEAMGFCFGFDASAEALALCRKRSLPRLCRAEINSALPIHSDIADVVMALDVLEHLDDDHLFLRECHRLLRHDGILLATVPAYQWLWSYWDISAGHRRRYTLQRLAAIVRQAGFRIVRISYYNSFILPGAAVTRWYKGRDQNEGKASDFLRVPAILNWGLQILGTIERRCLRLIRMPFGLSVIVVAQKRECSVKEAH
jgi:2-polyprenyl-3-methyl-5-hydroxy-6-metoxy-1,4-benzoquinol methylase